ncbi:hypothetical protein ACH5RR_027276 [Cinchona calisaya]|uniref:Serpin domain-containing protein n=1 Tax=Cinchona calisaya TaxID=153742 RepID=A0ABD2Z4Z8_9GENT
MFSMFIFLPNERDGLPSLLHKASNDPAFFSQQFNKLESRTYNVFWIPKFKFTYLTAKAPESLSIMGLDLPFQEDCKELTEIVETMGGPFYVSMIIQKAVVEVDEGGTTAAAVTYESDDDMGFSLYSEPIKIYEFVADHPFLFMIREEKSRSVLLAGAVLNPLLQE